MIGLLVVTHGQLAEDLVRAVEKIVGTSEALEAVSIDWDDDVDDARRRIEEAIDRLNDGDGVLILTAMFGGTPSNISLSLLEPGKVEIVTGVNLPMLIKFTNLREKLDLPEVACRIAEQGRKSITVATEILESRVEKAGEGKD
jgi:PTS system mannose-specific IIA component